MDVIFDGPPPQQLVEEPEDPTQFRPLAPLPDVTPALQDASQNPNAKQLDELGQALRAGLGIGALALLPDLIADLRRSKDPDTRIKFLALAFKEGGYGVKEDKTANLPVFHFNFVGGSAQVAVTPGQPGATGRDNSGAVDAQMAGAGSGNQQGLGFSAIPAARPTDAATAINADFQPADPVPAERPRDPPASAPSVQSIFDLIAG